MNPSASRSGEEEENSDQWPTAMDTATMLYVLCVRGIPTQTPGTPCYCHLMSDAPAIHRCIYYRVPTETAIGIGLEYGEWGKGRTRVTYQGSIRRHRFNIMHHG